MSFWSGFVSIKKSEPYQMALDLGQVLPLRCCDWVKKVLRMSSSDMSGLADIPISGYWLLLGLYKVTKDPVQFDRSVCCVSQIPPPVTNNAKNLH